MPSLSLEISKRTHRRFILGRQGLWPGRRWRGVHGILDAILQIESVQVDPVNIVAPSHDIVLWGRVLDYDPADLDTLLYTRRQLFDYGGNLNIFPIEERPYWLHAMRLRREEKRWKEFAENNQELIRRVRDHVAASGPTRKRDLEGEAVGNYRGSKDTGVALYYLWLTGELMSHSRVGRERVYDLAERVAPVFSQQAAPEDEAIHFLLMKEISQSGLIAASYFASVLKGLSGGRLDRAQAADRLQQLLAGGELAPVKVEGIAKTFYCLAEHAALLQDLQGGQTPSAWKPLGATTSKEVVLLSPLERVSARGRAKPIFDFDYAWEIYKPETERRYGPYTLPILYGDQLVGRIDGRLDREAGTLVINGLWFEDWFELDAQFSTAFQNGLARFLLFLGAAAVDRTAVPNYATLFA